MDTRSYIESLAARQVAPFGSIDVELNPYVNVIAGPNASGKTTLLRLLAWCLHHPSPGDYRFTPDSSCAASIVHEGRTQTCGVGPGTFEAASYREMKVRSWVAPPAQTGNAPAIASASLSSTDIVFAPLVIGPTRNFTYVKIAGMNREPSIEKARAKYQSEAVKRLHSTSIPSPKQWMINRYFVMDKPWATDLRANWTALVAKIEALAPFGATFQFKEIREDLEPRFELDGAEVFLEELSGGFQSVLSIALSIVEWIEQTNTGEKRAIAKASGTVLIDEIDAHLHPQWQMTVISGLRELFPNIQIIATTHSPHVIGACLENELLLIPQPSDGVQMKPLPHSFLGWTTEAILRLLMNVAPVDRAAYSSRYNDVLERVRNGTTEGFDDALGRLAEICAPDDPLIESLRAQMRSRAAEKVIGTPE